jgi:virulence-associated protein VagC
MSATAKLIMDGESQVVLLPEEFRFEGTEVRVSKVGDKVILEPLNQQTAAEKANKRAEVLKQIEQLNWPAPEGYKFDRDEANER